MRETDNDEDSGGKTINNYLYEEKIKSVANLAKI